MKWAPLYLAAPWAAAGGASSVDDCPGYTVTNLVRTDAGLTADLTLAGAACNVYGSDLSDLKLLVEYQTESRVHVKIYDAEEAVYQVPETVVPRPGSSTSASNALLQVSLVAEPFSFAVQRSDGSETIFNTSGSNIIFESQYLRLRTSLPPNPVLYGLGEHTDPLMLNTTNYTRTLWSRDAGAVPPGTNLYGNHPIYLEHRPQSNTTHGVILVNSNGMDIKINNTDQAGQYLEYNTLGGVIDLYFMAGPGPYDVAREISEVTGKAAKMPYWGFGFHQCRYGYSNVSEVAEVVYNYYQANIPLETMWTDIDYMNRSKVFTLDPENFPLEKMRELVDYLHDHDQHYIVMVDPAVAYQDYDAFNRGVEADAFLKTANGSICKGVVWPGVTAFPDWFHSNTQGYWNAEFDTFFNESTGVDIDALWIDMNEPSNFCVWPCDDPEGYLKNTTWTNPPPPTSPEYAPRPLTGALTDFQLPNPTLTKRQDNSTSKGLPGRDLINPPYTIQNAAGSLSNLTVRTDIVHANGVAEYDAHNIYGLMMSTTCRHAMLTRRPTLRPMVITRSTFISAGSHVGHWLGDNVSSWDQYRISIRHMLQFASFFQVPMVGSDVCGFLDNTTATLCARWATLGSFYPFYRNHNVNGARPQEFYRWPIVADAARSAINTRYRLLDYIYTAFHQQTVDGTPVLSPMWFLYPEDPNTFPIDLQYFYGPSLLVSPVTEENVTNVTIYLPKDKFYSLSDFTPVYGNASTTTLSNISYTDIPVHIRGGSIVPMRVSSANTTTALRQIDFELVVAPGVDGTARGQLYLDDGESLTQDRTSEIEFEYDGRYLLMNGTFYYDVGGVKIAAVRLLGKSDGPVRLALGAPLTQPFRVDLGDLLSKRVD